MRIAIFSDNFYPELSGIAGTIATIAPALAGRGHEIICFAPRYGSKDYAKAGTRRENPGWGPRVKFMRLPSFSVPTASGQGRAVLPTGKGFRILRHLRPDIIHVHQPYGAGLEGLLAAKLLKVPLVGTEHTPIREFALRYGFLRTEWWARLNTRYDAWFYNHCDFVSSPTKYIFADWDGFDQSVPHAAVPNPIDTGRFRPARQQPEPQAAAGGLNSRRSSGQFNLLYAGRLAKEKNISLMLQATAKLQEIIPEIRTVIIGSGPSEKNLRELAASLQIADRTDFLGFLPEPKLPQAYRQGNVFVIMSAAETQSIVAMQALLTEIPVVAASAWGLKEYVPPAVGIQVPLDNLPSLIRAIRKLYRAPALRLKMGRAGRKMVLNFSIPKIARLWERLYRETISYHRKNHAH